MECNRIFIISDTHLGIRSNSTEWLEIIKDYFYNWFIPMLKERVQPGDVLFHLGDLFDNRQSINILVQNTALEIFEEISKILPIYIILGNHDTYRKTSNDINSVKIFNYLNNITVYEEPTRLKLSKSKESKVVLLMPWRKSPEEEIDLIENNKSCNYLFCHTDINDIKYNIARKVEHGNNITVFNTFDRMFSGHIHYRQEYRNLIMVGSPYSLTRSDIDNQKGIYLFDPFLNQVEFIENNYSPKFLKYKIQDVAELTVNEFNLLIKNNFVDIITDQKWSMDFPFTSLMDILVDYKKINILSVNDEEQNNFYDESVDSDLSNFNIMKLSKTYIENLNFSDKMKDLLNKKINELYDRAILGNQIEIKI